MTLLRAAYHPTDVVVITNTEGRKTYINTTRLHHILIPGILQAYQYTTQTIYISPTQTPQKSTQTITLPPLLIRPLHNSHLHNNPHHTQQLGRLPTHNPTPSKKKPQTTITTRNDLALRSHNPTHTATHPALTSARRLIIQRRHKNGPRGPSQGRVSHRTIYRITYKPGRTHNDHTPPNTTTTTIPP